MNIPDRVLVQAPMKLGLPLLLAAGCVMSARVASAEMTVKPGQPPALKDFRLSLTISNLPTFSLLPDGTNTPACPLIGPGLNLPLSLIHI